MHASLVVDVGTSSVRAALATTDGAITHEVSRPLLPSSSAPGLVEFDPSAMGDAALDVARRVLAAAHDAHIAVEAVGIANQRASAILWDRSTGAPVSPGIGWQDLRTVVRCLELQAEGFRLAPNHSATKVEAMLDAVDPDRVGDLCFGTVDSWIAWTLSGGTFHGMDATNASVTGMTNATVADWDDDVLDALRIPRRILPAIVPSTGTLGEASALRPGVPITAMVGDQQASLLGQRCFEPGQAKITFGTGGMLDIVVGEAAPASGTTHADSPPDDLSMTNGTFPLVAHRVGEVTTWAREAVALAAGTNIEWLRDDLGLIDTAAHSAEVAGGCDDTGGVMFVPALLGLGTPEWDYGARGALLGLTRGSDRCTVVRAVLEGVAHRGADLVDAASAASGFRIDVIRIDGGMSANEVFVQALADASQCTVEVSPELEATALGAGFLAGLAVGMWRDPDAFAATWEPRTRVTPRRALDRERWRDAVTRARGWLPDLSAISFD